VPTTTSKWKRCQNTQWCYARIVLPYISQEAAQEIRQRVGPIRVEQIRREILDESNLETAHIREEIGPAHLEALRRIMEQDMKMNED
jgi:hypothetical protein